MYSAIFLNSLHLNPYLAKYDEIPLNSISIFLISGISLFDAFHARLGLFAQHHIASRGATISLNFSNIYSWNIFHKSLLCPVFTVVPLVSNDETSFIIKFVTLLSQKIFHWFNHCVKYPTSSTLQKFSYT